MLLVLAIFPALAASVNFAQADDLDPNDFKSSAARSAIIAYQRKIAAAEKEFRATAIRETKELIESLERAEKKAVSDKSPKEVQRIHETIAKLKETIPTPQENPRDAIIGVWRMEYSNNSVRYEKIVRKGKGVYAYRYQGIGPDARLISEGPVRFIANKYVVLYPKHNSAERFTPDGNRLLIELWYLDKDKSIDRFADLFGVGARVETK